MLVAVGVRAGVSVTASPVLVKNFHVSVVPFIAQWENRVLFLGLLLYHCLYPFGWWFRTTATSSFVNSIGILWFLCHK